MSAILLRPIREQFEHNRVIRILQGRFRRRFEVGINLGDEHEATAVRSGTGLVYPDLVLISADGPRRLHGVVEVETGESVNHLEAMAEWAPLGKVRGAFYLYVPAGATDVARRLCEEHAVPVTEIWSYHAVGDQMRFTMTYRSARASRARTAAKKGATGARQTAEAKRASKREGRGAAETARPAKASKRVGKTAPGRAPSARVTSTKRAGKSAAPSTRSTPTKAARKTAPTRAARKTAPTKAARKTAPTKAARKTAPTKARRKTAKPVRATQVAKRPVRSAKAGSKKPGSKKR